MAGHKVLRVLVVGDVMLDEYWMGDSQRLSPEAPVPVLSVYDKKYRLGGAANVAVNLSEWGVEVTLLGVVGDDEEGAKIRDLMKQNHIEDALLVQVDHMTTHKIRLLAKGHHLLRADFEKMAPKIFDYMDQYIKKNYQQYDVFIFSDYCKGTLHDFQSILKFLSQEKKRILVDPKETDPKAYPGSLVVTPNQKEFECWVGQCINQEKVLSLGESLRRKMGWHALIVTQSEQGMTLFIEGEEPKQFPSCAQKVFDVTGAGDTVLASLAFAYGQDWDWSLACRLANLNAGYVVAQLGTSQVPILQFLSHCSLVQQGENPIDGKILNEKELSMIVKKMHCENKKIVFTNGCFDLIHAGHVNYLKKARALGDVLIIGVNDDISVKRLKGDSRPIHSLNQRLEVLCGLTCVDYVIAFQEDTPLKLIHAIHPNVLVKAADYKPHEVVGADWVRSYGGELQLIPFVYPTSTSRIQSILEKENAME